MRGFTQAVAGKLILIVVATTVVSCGVSISNDSTPRGPQLNVEITQYDDWNNVETVFEPQCLDLAEGYYRKSLVIQRTGDETISVDHTVSGNDIAFEVFEGRDSVDEFSGTVSFFENPSNSQDYNYEPRRSDVSYRFKLSGPDCD